MDSRLGVKLRTIDDILISQNDYIVSPIKITQLEPRYLVAEVYVGLHATIRTNAMLRQTLVKGAPTHDTGHTLAYNKV